MTRKELLLSYILNESIRLENVITELRSNIMYRQNLYQYDLYDLMIAIAERDKFKQTSHEIMQIYNITADDIYNLKRD